MGALHDIGQVYRREQHVVRRPVGRAAKRGDAGSRFWLSKAAKHMILSPTS